MYCTGSIGYWQEPGADYFNRFRKETLNDDLKPWKREQFDVAWVLVPRVLSAADVLVSSNAKEALDVSLNFMIPANENQGSSIYSRAGFQWSEIKLVSPVPKYLRDQCHWGFVFKVVNIF